MRLSVLVARNAFLGCTGQPKFDDHTPDVFAKSFERHLLTGEEAQVFQFENVSWFHLGDYDDETMKFEALKEPVKILDCGKVLEERKIRSKLIDSAKEKENVKD